MITVKKNDDNRKKKLSNDIEKNVKIKKNTKIETNLIIKKLKRTKKNKKKYQKKKNRTFFIKNKCLMRLDRAFRCPATELMIFET